MTENLEDQLRDRLQRKTDEELIEIWRKDDRTEWTDEALAVVREILLERLGELPSQVESEEAASVAGERDTYYDFKRFTSVASWAAILSWFCLGLGVLFIILGVLTFHEYRSAVSGINIFSSLLYTLFYAMISFFFFVLLRGLSEVAYLLMDIEENTR